jgi:hypothetical protein
MTQALAIGQSLTFTNTDGHPVTGTIVGRDWSFSTLIAYTVEIHNGMRYHVNASTLQSGHSF